MNHVNSAPAQEGTPAKTLLISKLFTVRNRPVLFTKENLVFSEALYATERGEFPISPTGYRSMAGCLCVSKGKTAKRLDDVVTAELLEGLATEHERNLKGAKSRANRMPKYRHRGTVGEYISLEMDAIYAASYGLFASDKDRMELWQAVYRLYYLICESGIFIPCQMAEDHPAWDVKSCEAHLLQARKSFVLLQKVMSGDFSIESADTLTVMKCLGSYSYFELPPKPGGEPVIPPPTIEMSFDFAEETASLDDDGDCNDSAENHEDNVSDSESADPVTPENEQLALF